MALQSIYYYSKIPDEVIDLIERDLKEAEYMLFDSSVGHGSTGSVVKDIRNSSQSWIPSEHWIGGFMWHYIQRANRENFLYDINCIECENMQYTVYNEGTYYKWHTDSSIEVHYKPQVVGDRVVDNMNVMADDYINKNCERIRKLSFSLLLTDPREYEGGNLQIMDERGESYIAPRQKGVIIVFDSRARHRVTKVTKGVRKSLVGWVSGPRWR